MSESKGLWSLLQISRVHIEVLNRKLIFPKHSVTGLLAHHFHLFSSFPLVVQTKEVRVCLENYFAKICPHWQKIFFWIIQIAYTAWIKCFNVSLCSIHHLATSHCLYVIQWFPHCTWSSWISRWFRSIREVGVFYLCKSSLLEIFACLIENY